MALTHDLTGMRFNRLTPTERANSKSWLCRCDCGNTTTVYTSAIVHGKTKSCGCLRADQLRREPVRPVVGLETSSLKALPCENCQRPTAAFNRKYCSPACRKAALNQRVRPAKTAASMALRVSDPARHLLYQIKHRAKVNGIPFNLIGSDLVFPTHCPVLGLKLEWARERLTPNSYSVDRIRPALGYVAGNVRIISFRANQLKSNATVEELTRVLEDLKILEKTCPI